MFDIAPGFDLDSGESLRDPILPDIADENAGVELLGVFRENRLLDSSPPWPKGKKNPPSRMSEAGEFDKAAIHRFNPLSHIGRD